MKKFWITKHALTSGVILVDGELEEGSSGKTFCRYKRPGFSGEYAHGNDFHTTEEAARVRFEQMRLKKLASLQKQLDKLMSPTFVVKVIE